MGDMNERDDRFLYIIKKVFPTGTSLRLDQYIKKIVTKLFPTLFSQQNAGGDLTGSFPNPTLSNTGVTANTYGSATQIPVLAVNSKGRITSASNQAITIPEYNNVPTTGRYINPLVAIGGWSGALATTNNRIYLTPIYIGRDCTIDRLAGWLRSHVGASAGVKFLIYSNNDATNLPETLLLNSGALTTTSTSFSLMAATVNYSITGGRMYWFGLVSNGNLGFVNSNNNSVFNIASILGSNTSALMEAYMYTDSAGSYTTPPSSLTGASYTYGTSTNVPCLTLARISALN